MDMTWPFVKLLNKWLAQLKIINVKMHEIPSSINEGAILNTATAAALLLRPTSSSHALKRWSDVLNALLAF